MSKTCSKCKKRKDITGFPLLHGKPRAACKECARKAWKAWYKVHRKDRVARSMKWAKENRPRERANRKKNTRAIKEEMIREYGGKCECCGETAFEFLSIDHVNGDGHKERKALGGAGEKMYRSLKRRGWPREGYRLLCMNCNFAFGRYGRCPHKTSEMMTYPRVH